MEGTNNIPQTFIEKHNTVAIKAEEPVYASFFWRAAAFCTDLSVIAILSAIFYVVPLAILTKGVFFTLLCVFLALFIIRLLYFSPGRALYDLRITDIKGKPLIWWKTILHTFISVLVNLSAYAFFVLLMVKFLAGEFSPILLSFIPLASFYAFMYTNPKRQTLYDKFLGSVVITKKEENRGCFIYCIAFVSLCIPIIVLAVGEFIVLGSVH